MPSTGVSTLVGTPFEEEFYLIHALVPDMKGDTVERIYDVQTGDYICRFAHSSAMQEHWVLLSTMDETNPNYSWGIEIRHLMVTSDGFFIGCFWDFIEFEAFINHWMRGKILEVVK